MSHAISYQKNYEPDYSFRHRDTRRGETPRVLMTSDRIEFVAPGLDRIEPLKEQLTFWTLAIPVVEHYVANLVEVIPSYEVPGDPVGAAQLPRLKRKLRFVNEALRYAKRKVVYWQNRQTTFPMRCG